MDGWTTALTVIGGVLLVLRLAFGPARPERRSPAPLPDEVALQDEPEPWTAEALARHGTDTSIADLAAQGRADELRGLGYTGDIPED